MTMFRTAIRRAARRLDDWTLHTFNPRYPVRSRS